MFVGRRLSIICFLLLFAGAEAVLGATALGEPRDQLQPKDVRLARAALLRRSDLISTFRPDHEESHFPIVPRCRDFPGDRSNITISGEAKSAFTDGRDLISSATLLFKTYADADRYWATTARPRFVTCFAEGYEATQTPAVKVKNLFARQIRLGPTGVDRAVAYRTITAFTRHGRRHDWYDTAVFLRSGRGVSRIRVAYVNQPCDCYAGLARVLALRLIATARG